VASSPGFLISGVMNAWRKTAGKRPAATDRLNNSVIYGDSRSVKARSVGMNQGLDLDVHLDNFIVITGACWSRRDRLIWYCICKQSRESQKIRGVGYTWRKFQIIKKGISSYGIDNGVGKQNKVLGGRGVCSIESLVKTGKWSDGEKWVEKERWGERGVRRGYNQV